MKIVYGTKNQAKLDSMKKMLHGLPIEIIGVDELGIKIENIKEKGNNPLENAIIKAEAYYEIIKLPVFSCDSGLWIEGLEEYRQPGSHVRRVNGKVLTDDEMIEYYSCIAREFNGKVKAKYKNAICLIINEREKFESMEQELSSEKFILTDVPHKIRVDGFPLDSISIEENSGKYYIDIKDEKVESNMVGKGFRTFFENILKGKGVII